MQLAPFLVERWLNTHEQSARYNLAETDAKPFTVQELLQQANADTTKLLDLHISYNPTLGSAPLRDLIASFYPGTTADNVLITTGAMEADFLLANILVQPGDTVIVQYPAYQALYSVAEARGAKVKRWHLTREQKFKPDLNKLEQLLDEKTKVVILNIPHNPTGAIINHNQLRTILAWAEEKGFWVLCDEVYHDLAADSQVPPYAAALSPKAISVGSMSKAYGLSGLRLGWFVGPPHLVQQAWQWKDYTTISISPISDFLARLALSHKDAIMMRNKAIANANWQLLLDWLRQWAQLVDYVPPAAGVLIFPWLKQPQLSGTDFCQGAFDQKGVLLVPGEAFGYESHFRLGFGGDTETFSAGLEQLSQYCTQLS
ncbi:MAG TPA: aminotransferase class I/II-fold pyridoxal phosphate-dependent enzyme [bacterium]|jgi:aspartate/methionine/tyrosine aminotransferase|nr:aminotransferase class I/II-fold pyridoxal phosphate-dependent enzyme [bacterium]